MFAFFIRVACLPTLKKWALFTSLIVTGCSLPSLSVAGDDRDHQHNNQHNQALHNQTQAEKHSADPKHDPKHEHDESVTIDSDSAKQSNISTTTATSGMITKTSRLYGKVVNDATQISHISARFDGTIINVNVNIGDVVKKGQALARIESNQSLHPYIVTAPFSGMITARHANPGELTQAQPLFTLFNDAILWAEFKIFPKQMRTIKAEQSIMIDGETFRIARIIPSPNNEPFSLARVQLDNHDHGWSAGVTIKADTIITEKNVAVRIQNNALQQLEGRTVAFIKQGDTYQAKPLTLGLQDTQYSEVLSGLALGDEYVLNNSYLIKADFEKAGAEHVH